MHHLVTVVQPSFVGTEWRASTSFMYEYFAGVTSPLGHAGEMVQKRGPRTTLQCFSVCKTKVVMVAIDYSKN